MIEYSPHVDEKFGNSVTLELKFPTQVEAGTMYAVKDVLERTEQIRLEIHILSVFSENQKGL